MSMSTTYKSQWRKYTQAAHTVQGGAVSKETADDILEDAKGRVHVISGATRDSGRVVATAGGYDVVFEEGAIFEEYGTVYRPPHPFLTPASEAHRSGYLDRLQNALMGQ